MKKWKIVRDTLGFFGINSKEAKDNGIKVESIDSDITVHYSTENGINFSGNITNGDHGITDDVLVPDVPGQIIIGDGSTELYITTGVTENFIITDEEGNVLADADFTVTTSKATNVSVTKNSGIDIVGNIELTEATITVKLVSNVDVFSKLKVYVIE